MLGLLAVDAAHWWGPLGWTYKNCTGNIAASLLWAGPPFIAGAVWGKHRAEKGDAHAHWMAQHMANVHLSATGSHADPHPHHGQLTGES